MLLSTVKAFHATLTSVVAASNDGDGGDTFTLEQARDVARDARWRVPAEAGAYAAGDNARPAGGSGSAQSAKDRIDVERFVECVAQLTKSDLHTLARRTADAASVGGIVSIAADADSVVETMLRSLDPFDSADEGLVSHLEVHAVLQRHGVPLTWSETVMLCLEFRAPPGTRRSAHSEHRLRVQYERLVAALFG